MYTVGEFGIIYLPNIKANISVNASILCKSQDMFRNQPVKVSPYFIVLLNPEVVNPEGSQVQIPLLSSFLCSSNMYLNMYPVSFPCDLLHDNEKTVNIIGIFVFIYISNFRLMNILLGNYTFLLL